MVVMLSSIMKSLSDLAWFLMTECLPLVYTQNIFRLLNFFLSVLVKVLNFPLVPSVFTPLLAKIQGARKYLDELSTNMEKDTNDAGCSGLLDGMGRFVWYVFDTYLTSVYTLQIVKVFNAGLFLIDFLLGCFILLPFVHVFREKLHLLMKYTAALETKLKNPKGEQIPTTETGKRKFDQIKEQEQESLCKMFKAQEAEATTKEDTETLELEDPKTEAVFEDHSVVHVFKPEVHQVTPEIISNLGLAASKNEGDLVISKPSEDLAKTQCRNVAMASIGKKIEMAETVENIQKEGLEDNIGTNGFENTKTDNLTERNDDQTTSSSESASASSKPGQDIAEMEEMKTSDIDKAIIAELENEALICKGLKPVVASVESLDMNGTVEKNGDEDKFIKPIQEEYHSSPISLKPGQRNGNVWQKCLEEMEMSDIDTADVTVGKDGDDIKLMNPIEEEGQNVMTENEIEEYHEAEAKEINMDLHDEQTSDSEDSMEELPIFNRSVSFGSPPTSSIAIGGPCQHPKFVADNLDMIKISETNNGSTSDELPNFEGINTKCTEEALEIDHDVDVPIEETQIGENEKPADKIIESTNTEKVDPFEENIARFSPKKVGVVKPMVETSYFESSRTSDDMRAEVAKERSWIGLKKSYDDQKSNHDGSQISENNVSSNENINPNISKAPEYNSPKNGSDSSNFTKNSSASSNFNKTGSSSDTFSPQGNQKGPNSPSYNVEGSKLFVYGVDERIGEEDLAKEFGEYGEVLNVYNTGKGYAFVTMGTPEQANCALEKLDGSQVFGNEIKVSIAVAKPSGGGRGRPSPRGYGGGQQRGRGEGGQQRGRGEGGQQRGRGRGGQQRGRGRGGRGRSGYRGYSAQTPGY